MALRTAFAISAALALPAAIAYACGGAPQPAPGRATAAGTASIPAPRLRLDQPAPRSLLDVEAGAYPSLQAAIDALPATGGTIRLASRAYVLPRPLVLRAGTALVGPATGNRAVLRLAPGIADPVVTGGGGEARRDGQIRLAGFDVDGDRAGRPGRAPAVYLDGVEGAVIEDLVVRDAPGSGLQLRRFRSGVVRRCTITRCGVGSPDAASGINLNDACDDNLVEDNVCVGMNPGAGQDGNGIRIGDGSDRNVVRGNRCEGNGRRGIKVQGAHNAVVANVLAGNDGHSLLVGGLACHDNLIARNAIDAPYHAAIHVTGAAGGEGTFRNAIEGNRITGGFYGIEVGWDAQETRIVGNAIAGTRLHGIFLRGSSDNLVEGNDVFDSGFGRPANAISIVPQAGRQALRNVVRRNACSDRRALKFQRHGLKTEPGADWTKALGNDFRGNAVEPGMALAGPNDEARDNRL